MREREQPFLISRRTAALSLSLFGTYEKVDWYGLDSRCPKEATEGIDPEENLLPP